VFDDDWYTSLFVMDNVTVGEGATLQIGEYAVVKADLDAGKSSRLLLGYNSSAEPEERILRCYAIINIDSAICSRPTRTQEALSALPASALTDNIRLADNASLYLGKIDYIGAVKTSGSASMTMDSTAYWQMNGNSNLSRLKALNGAKLSMVPGGNWSPKHLQIDSLDATGLTLTLGVNPATAQNDKLTIKNSVSGSNNILDVSLILKSSQPYLSGEKFRASRCPGRHRRQRLHPGKGFQRLQYLYPTLPGDKQKRSEDLDIAACKDRMRRFLSVRAPHTLLLSALRWQNRVS